jgi:hypothetical protein
LHQLAEKRQPGGDAGEVERITKCRRHDMIIEKMEYKITKTPKG